MTGRASCAPWSGWRCGPRRRLRASRGGSGSGGCSPRSCPAPQLRPCVPTGHPTASHPTSPAVEKAQEPAQLPWSRGSWIIPGHFAAASKWRGSTSLESMVICQGRAEGCSPHRDPPTPSPHPSSSQGIPRAGVPSQQPWSSGTGIRVPPCPRGAGSLNFPQIWAPQPQRFLSRRQHRVPGLGPQHGQRQGTAPGASSPSPRPPVGPLTQTQAFRSGEGGTHTLPPPLHSSAFLGRPRP